MTHVSWAALYEGATNWNLDVLIPRMMEDIIVGPTKKTWT